MTPRPQERDSELPGVVHRGQLSDANERLFYKRWAEIMDAENWCDVRFVPQRLAPHAEAAE